MIDTIAKIFLKLNDDKSVKETQCGPWGTKLTQQQRHDYFHFKGLSLIGSLQTLIYK